MAQTTARVRRQRGAAATSIASRPRTGSWRASLMRRCGELGLLGIGVPEEYGGLDLDKASSLVVVERIARSASFCDDVRRAGQPLHPAARAVRHAGAEGSSTCRGSSPARSIGAYALSESGSGSDALAAKTRADEAAGRQLGPQRREDVDQQRRLRRPVHRLCEGRRRAVHRVHRRARVPRRQLRQGRAQDGPARLVDDADPAAGRAGAGRQRARRDRQGPQGRAQHAELRPLQPGRDVHRRLPRGDRRRGEVRGAAAAVRPADRAASAPSSTSSAR